MKNKQLIYELGRYPPDFKVLVQHPIYGDVDLALMLRSVHNQPLEEHCLVIQAMPPLNKNNKKE